MSMVEGGEVQMLPTVKPSISVAAAATVATA